MPAAAPIAAPAPALEPAPAPAPALANEQSPEQSPAAPWPEDCPPLAGGRVLEVARISANVGDSPPGAVYVEAHGELQATYAAWRDAAKARGFRVLAEHTSEYVRAASLIDAKGGRAYILMQRGGEEGELAGMFNRGRSEPTRLRGPCVAVSTRTREFDVERSAIVHNNEFRRERVIEHHETRFGHDFDADGELDLLVPTSAPATCPADLTWTVYLARGGCFHQVGKVGPGDLSYDDGGAAAGPRPLLFEAQSTELGAGGSVSTTIRTTYTFKGARYVRSARDVDRGVCAHCAVEVCRPPPRG